MSLDQRRKEGGDGKQVGPGAASGGGVRPQPAHKPKDKDDKPKEEVKVSIGLIETGFKSLIT